MRALPSRGLGSDPVFPAPKNPTKPTSRDTFQGWLKKAKRAAIKAAPEEAKDHLKERFRGVAFHAEKRALVRDPEFRRKPPKIQETFVGTSHETLRNVYDEVTPDDLRAAMGFPDPMAEMPEIDTNREWEPRMNNQVG